MYKNSTLFFILLVFITIATNAQVSFTSTSNIYTEDFNTLPSTGASATWTNNTTLINWYSDKTTIYISNGTTPTTISLNSYGTTGSTERAIGAQGALGTTYMAIRLRNDDATQNIISFDVVYIGEQWREGSSAGTMNVEYQVGATGFNTPSTGWTAISAIDFSSIVNTTNQALNGNLLTYQSEKEITVTVTVTPGQECWIRWKFTQGSGGNKCGLGVDDVQIIANYTSSCTAPTVQASDMTFSLLSPNFYTVNWTNGNGRRRLLLGKESSVPNTPTLNTNYSSIDNSAWNAYPANELPPSGSGTRILYDDISNFINVSGLQPETQYCFTVYEYLGLHCYNMTPLEGCRYTLSLQPTVNSNTLTASSSAASEIDLTFQSMASAGLPATNHGYIIIQKLLTAPTDLPADGTFYSIGDAIGTSKVAAIITNPSQTSVHLTGLYDNAVYCYKIYSFRWDGTNGETVNYYTPAIVPNSCDFVLPIELTSFTVQCAAENIYQLKWTTATEINSGQFIVQRSFDGMHFSDIATIAANSNSSFPVNYQYMDTTDNDVIVYYKLKEIDAGGNTYESKIIYTKCRTTSENNIVYLNESKQLAVHLNAIESNPVTISIIDNSGKIVYKKNIGIVSDNNTFLVQLPVLARGIYAAVLYKQNSKQSLRFFYY